ncbi:hypothetical protein ACLFKT_01725 [Paraburkholderia sp. BR14261]
MDLQCPGKHIGGQAARRQLNTMNATLLSATAALFGAAIGGLTSLVTQRTQARAEWLAHDRIRRQDLYREFIEQASQCYVHALQHKEPDVTALVSLFAKISRMRVQSSTEVSIEADQIGRKIVDTYDAPEKTFVELREMLADGSIDILNRFSDLCRDEFDSLRSEQF